MVSELFILLWLLHVNLVFNSNCFSKTLINGNVFEIIIIQNVFIVTNVFILVQLRIIKKKYAKINKIKTLK